MKNIDIDGRKVRMQVVIFINYHSGIRLDKIGSELLLPHIISSLFNLLKRCSWNHPCL